MKTFREFLVEISKETKTRYLGFDLEKGPPGKYDSDKAKERYNKGAWNRMGKMYQIRREMEKTGMPEYGSMIKTLSRKIKNRETGIERAHNQ